MFSVFKKGLLKGIKDGRGGRCCIWEYGVWLIYN